MTPEEKAKELVTKYWNDVTMNLNLVDYGEDRAKESAIICVKEIIEASPTNPRMGGYIEIYSDMVDEAIEFWTEVLIEIGNVKL